MRTHSPMTATVPFYRARLSRGFRHCIAALLLVDCAPSAGFAQEPVPREHAHRCEVAIAQAQRDELSIKDRRPWAIGSLPTCGPAAGLAIAELIHGTRFSNDQATLDSLTQVTLRFTDGAVFNEALSIADDRAASVVARILAVRTLIYAFQPFHRLSYEQITGAGATGIPNCVGSQLGSDSRSPGAPIRPDGRSLVVALASRLVADKSEPKELRAAASCVSVLID